MSRRRESGRRSHLHVISEPDYHVKTNCYIPRRNIWEFDQMEPLQSSSSVCQPPQSRGAGLLKEDILDSGSPTRSCAKSSCRYTYNTNYDLDTRRLAGRPDDNDLALDFPVKRRKSFAPGYLKHPNRGPYEFSFEREPDIPLLSWDFGSMKESLLGRESCMPLLGWNYGTMKDKDFPNVTADRELDTYHTSPTSFADVDYQESLNSKHATDWGSLSSLHSNGCSKYTSTPYSYSSSSYDNHTLRGDVLHEIAHSPKTLHEFPPSLPLNYFNLANDNCLEEQGTCNTRSLLLAQTSHCFMPQAFSVKHTLGMEEAPLSSSLDLAFRRHFPGIPKEDKRPGHALEWHEKTICLGPGGNMLQTRMGSSLLREAINYFNEDMQSSISVQRAQNGPTLRLPLLLDKSNRI